MSEIRYGMGGESGQVEPPYIIIAGDADSPLVAAATAGIEEEGVPSRVRALDGSPVEQARSAATASPLQVGLAIVGDAICLTHAKFPADRTVAQVRGAGIGQARRLGHAAARIVLSVPLPGDIEGRAPC